MTSYEIPDFESIHSMMSVQDLAKTPMPSIPQCFVRSKEPTVLIQTPSLPDVPTIDMGNLVLEEAIDSELERLHSTCKNWGIFQLVNHGVDPELLEKLKYETEELFKLPYEEKMKYKMKSDGEGYGNVKRGDDKFDWGDKFYFRTNPLHIRKSSLLQELPSSLRTTVECYITELQKLAMKLFGLLEKALKMETKEMSEMFEDGIQSTRMTYYPPCPQPELVLGFTPHSDATGITILNQLNGVNGLEIKKDGKWIPVNVHSSNALLVNVGDLLEIISNGMYKSVEHRVTVNSKKERISIAMFFIPKSECEIGPAKSLINEANPPLFKRILVEDYVRKFFSLKLSGKSYLELMRIQQEQEVGANTL